MVTVHTEHLEPILMLNRAYWAFLWRHLHEVSQLRLRIETHAEASQEIESSEEAKTLRDRWQRFTELGLCDSDATCLPKIVSREGGIADSDKPVRLAEVKPVTNSIIPDGPFSIDQERDVLAALSWNASEVSALLDVLNKRVLDHVNGMTPQEPTKDTEAWLMIVGGGYVRAAERMMDLRVAQVHFAFGSRTENPSCFKPKSDIRKLHEWCWEETVGTVCAIVRKRAQDLDDGWRKIQQSRHVVTEAIPWPNLKYKPLDCDFHWDPADEIDASAALGDAANRMLSSLAKDIAGKMNAKKAKAEKPVGAGMRYYEVNPKIARLLPKEPVEPYFTARQLARRFRCSPATVLKCPAWSEYRDKCEGKHGIPLSKGRRVRVQSLDSVPELASREGGNEEDSPGELQRLIKSQRADAAEDEGRRPRRRTL